MAHLDPALEAVIREALADPTASYTDIAEKVGCHKTTIRRHAIRWGLARNVHLTITDEQREKIRRMLRAGCWTNQQIATGSGCSRGTVQELAAAIGLDRTALRRPGSGRKGKTR